MNLASKGSSVHHPYHELRSRTFPNAPSKGPYEHIPRGIPGQLWFRLLIVIGEIQSGGGGSDLGRPSHGSYNRVSRESFLPRSYFGQAATLFLTGATP